MTPCVFADLSKSSLQTLVLRVPCIGTHSAEWSRFLLGSGAPVVNSTEEKRYSSYRDPPITKVKSSRRIRKLGCSARFRVGEQRWSTAEACPCR